jgi:hypothetical protein
VCNRRKPLISGLIAGGARLKNELLELLCPHTLPLTKS